MMLYTNRVDGAGVTQMKVPQMKPIHAPMLSLPADFDVQPPHVEPDAPTRVLLAVIAKHPGAVEDVLRTAI